MNRQQKHPHLAVRNAAYRKALQRLDQALERNSRWSNAEKIQLLGRLMFGDSWDEVEESDSPERPE